MAEKKSDYKKLFSNTLIFALGSFSSKVLMILLVSVYTNYLTKAEQGINEIIQQIANWLIPVVTMTISESVIRFGLDKAYDKKKVFTVGNLACLGGFAVLGIVLPIVTVSGVADKYLNGYSLLIYIYIVAASLKLVYSNFLRAIEKVRLFAVNAIVNTLLTLIGTVLFLIVFRMGNKGYLYSIIAADLLSVVFMCFAAKLWKYFDLLHPDKKMVRLMLSYAIPLIPAQIMWLITNSSDTFMTTHYLDKEATGVLSASYKIANLVSTVYLMFGQAWNMSAVLEDDSDDRDEFYSNVFYLNQCLLYILAAGCLMICAPLTQIWMGESVWESMRYSPILIYSTIFSCFTTFMGSIYLASNKTGRSLVTSLIAGVINVTLNIILIPRIGLYGPPITTVVSYIAVFVVRCFDSRSIVPFELNIRKIVINASLLAGMTFVTVMQNLNHGFKVAAYIVLPLMFILITAMNIKPVWAAAMKLMPAKIRGICERIGNARLIAMGFAAAAFAVVCFLWHMVLTVTCLVVFSAAAAFGVKKENLLIRLGGLGGIFLTVWAAYGISCALIAVLVLCALDYIFQPHDVICAVGAAALIGTMGAVFGVWAGVFTLLVVTILAVIGNYRRIAKFLDRHI
ncbi:Membrane protein involved in the export of O-antigen and teichoic acid [Ruminococcus sp. YE71]|uniref:oligosaccharide flippase family protein n=1 Tax=unclassified Ruminococcus TaxID=2608920 RepID=UPI00088BD689|nr:MULTISPECIES: polysaccharide biosynthesis C-terminal domain-containing protein [unclassified Ruminococcus]SDA09446.1 Membrane protein involved in the export of O-antigen and teichoic acid [Ruminococcus sp. YE78]SFW12258.1 Membrane protein involved in the export of O-antigen and teichoic acid [Ruminococcus sp. YE71]